MYAKIFNGLLAANGIEGSDSLSQIKYLGSLRASAKRLWQAYQNQAVAVSYSDKDVQEAYLLRYFVPYSYLLPTLLKSLESQGTIVSCDDGLLSACFFGCGPGPELAGLIRHLSQKSFRPDMVVAHMFDAASDTWAHGRSIFTNSVLAAEWDPALIETTPYFADISSVDFLANETVRRSVIDANLVVFQNCLNELSPARSAATADNLRAVIQAAKNTALVVFIERDGYDQTRDMLVDLCHWASNIQNLATFFELTDKAVFNCRPLLDGMPSIITEQLFTRKRDMTPIQSNEYGLILAADVKYKWLAVSKSNARAA